jgi:hypothetical protein
MAAEPSNAGHASGPSPSAPHRVCHLSRRRGWIDPADPHRPTSDVNLLAIALDSRVWTLDTAWDSIFHYTVPRPIARAFRKAMTRVTVTDDEVELLASVARRLGVELVVHD